MIQHMKIDGICVTLIGLANVDRNEAKRYVDYVKQHVNPALPVTAVEVIASSDDSVVINYEQNRPFERIRRITGYLTGTLDSWNDSKRAEERDRVKHEV